MSSFFPRRCQRCQASAGFTLIEILVVIAIMGLITTFLFMTFARSRIDIRHVTAAIAGDIRAAQAQAAASAKYQNVFRCGFGIRYLGGTTYGLYAGADASNPAVTCATQNRNFDANDAMVRVMAIADSHIEFKNPFADIFFEPPDPKTYLNNNALIGIPPERILVGPQGVGCVANPDKCAAICVYVSGKIELPAGTLTCP